MSDRAAGLVARAWRRATKSHLETEGFIEDALAAALDDAEVWARFVTHLGWRERMPARLPLIKTQTVVEAGRADIWLEWDDHRPVVLELKVGDAPAATQISKYLQAGAIVAAIAKSPAIIPLTADDAERFLGVVTWQRLRSLDWKGAPLALRQLHHLLDETGVAVPGITRDALTGMVASWDAWSTLDDWSRSGIQAIQHVLDDAGLPCVKWPTHIDRRFRRYVYWLSPPPLRDDGLWFMTGLYIGDPGDPPTLVDGIPDLVLALEVQPRTRLARVLREDATFTAAVHSWIEAGAGQETREFRPARDEWQPVVARTSAMNLLEASDQGERFVAWMAATAEAWVAHGIIGRLAELELQTRPATGEAPGGAPEGQNNPQEG